MKRELEITGPPFRGAPVVPALVSPTPLITVRDEDGELLLEVRSSVGGFELAFLLAGLAFVPWVLTVSVRSIGVSVAVGCACAWSALWLIREATTTTTLRLCGNELIVDELGVMRRSQQRLPLADLGTPTIDEWMTDEGPAYALLMPRGGKSRNEAIRALGGHEREHLAWLVKVLTTRMHALVDLDKGEMGDFD